MGSTASRRSTDVLRSSDRNAAPKALVGVAFGHCDTFVNLLCRDINETASSFRDARIVTTKQDSLDQPSRRRLFFRPATACPSEHEITIAKLAEFRKFDWIYERRFFAPSVTIDTAAQVFAEMDF